MKHSVKMHLPVWVIVVAVALTAVVSWSVIRMSHMAEGNMGQMAVSGQMQQQMQTVSATLDKAQAQLAVALQHADLANKASDLAGLQVHVHHVLNILEGKEGPDYDAAAGDPGDGHGVQVYLQDVSNMPMNSNPVMMDMMKAQGMHMMMLRDQMLQTLQNVQKASADTVVYLKEALKASMLDAAQKPLTQATSTLQQMQGTSEHSGRMGGTMVAGLTTAQAMIAQMMSMMGK